MNQTQSRLLILEYQSKGVGNLKTCKCSSTLCLYPRLLFLSTLTPASHACHTAIGLRRIMQGSCQSLDVVVGTPAFMGPELLTSNAFNGRLADVWALGATIYMLLCGHPPFVASQLMELYDKVEHHGMNERTHTHF